MSGSWVPAIRWGVPGALLLAAFVVPFLEDDTGVAVTISGMFMGAALAIWLIGALVRIGNEGDTERDREEAARAYFDEHGHWPDERSS